MVCWLAEPCDLLVQAMLHHHAKFTFEPEGVLAPGCLQGWRISLNGNKFKILGVDLFNIVDFSGTKMGQAAVFKQYETEDGKVVEVKATPWQAPQVEARRRGKHLCGRHEGGWSAAAALAA